MILSILAQVYYDPGSAPAGWNTPLPPLTDGQRVLLYACIFFVIGFTVVWLIRRSEKKAGRK